MKFIVVVPIVARARLPIHCRCWNARVRRTEKLFETIGESPNRKVHSRDVSFLARCSHAPCNEKTFVLCFILWIRWDSSLETASLILRNQRYHRKFPKNCNREASREREREREREMKIFIVGGFAGICSGGNFSLRQNFHSTFFEPKKKKRKQKRGYLDAESVLNHVRWRSTLASDRSARRISAALFSNSINYSRGEGVIVANDE